jgi:hypothetical protein
MIGRPRFVGVGAVCLAMVGVVPATAQQVAVEQGLAASTLSVYTPPACVPGVPFADITCTTGFDPWIEQFGLDGITAGCGGGNYCPGTPVTRDQMAVFIEKAIRGTSNWPPHTVLVFHHPAAEASSDVNSGTELLSMVAAIPSTGSEAPSASNPWLIRLGPGIYDLGSGSLTLPTRTALEGAGRDITVITAIGFSNFWHGTVIMGDHGKLSRLTVNNSGGNSYEIAVDLSSQASEVALEHVTITASNPSNVTGTAYGVYADTNTSFSLVDCELTVHGANLNFGLAAASSTDEARLDGVRVNVYGSNNSSGASNGFFGNGASPAISNSRFYVYDGAVQWGIHAIGGGGALDLRNSEVYTHGPGAAVYAHDLIATLLGDFLSSQGYGVDTAGSGLSADISNCNITGATNWLNNGSGFAVTVGASKLVGTTSFGGGTVNCFGNYTGTAFLATTCP